MDILDQKLPFIISVILFWTCYFVYRTKKNKWLLKYWGLSFSDSKELFKIVMIIGLPTVIAIIGYGIYFKPIYWSINIACYIDLPYLEINSTILDNEPIRWEYQRFVKEEY